jgi:hypothetical protein
MYNAPATYLVSRGGIWRVSDWDGDLTEEIVKQLHVKIKDAYEQAIEKGRRALKFDLGLKNIRDERTQTATMLAARFLTAALAPRGIPAWVDTKHYPNETNPTPHIVIGWLNSEHQLALRQYLAHPTEQSPYSTKADAKRDAQFGLKMLEGLQKVLNPNVPAHKELLEELPKRRQRLLKELEED